MRVRDLQFTIYNSSIGPNGKQAFKGIRSPRDIRELEIDNMFQQTPKEKKNDAQESAIKIKEYIARKKLKDNDGNTKT